MARIRTWFFAHWSCFVPNEIKTLYTPVELISRDSVCVCVRSSSIGRSGACYAGAVLFAVPLFPSPTVSASACVPVSGVFRFVAGHCRNRIPSSYGGSAFIVGRLLVFDFTRSCTGFERGWFSLAFLRLICFNLLLLGSSFAASYVPDSSFLATAAAPHQ